jgi:hypothetical protein
MMARNSVARSMTFLAAKIGVMSTPAAPESQKQGAFESFKGDALRGSPGRRGATPDGHKHTRAERGVVGIVGFATGHQPFPVEAPGPHLPGAYIDGPRASRKLRGMKLTIKTRSIRCSLIFDPLLHVPDMRRIA